MCIIILYVTKTMKSHCLVAAVLLQSVLFYLAYSCSNSINGSTSNNTNNIKNDCPIWTTQTDNNTCSCFFGYNTYLLECSDDGMTATVPYCYCVSYNERHDTVVIGYCVFRCHIQKQNPARKGQESHRYRLLATTNNKSNINRALCSDLQMNRTGQLCGSCLGGHTPPVYSYDMACVKCSDYKYNWLKYIAIAYLPLTVFYIAAVILRIPATSGRLNGFIMTCQIIASPTHLRTMYARIITNTGNNIYTKIGVKAAMTIYGIWNLDYFRVLYPPFCLHPSMNTLSTLALDYAVAIYPLVLVVITYNLVNLHDHSPLFVRLWRPLYRCFICVRREWNIKSSLISTFATFILVSYVKILNISFDLLATTHLYDLEHENSIDTGYLMSDGTIRSLGKQHRPYAMLAMFMLLLFNIIPLVLLLIYPCRYFQKCMAFFKLHSHVLNTFIDIFQGHFRTYPRDYRYFAAFYLLLRMVYLVIISFTNAPMSNSLGGILMVSSGLLVAVVQPYKQQVSNKRDAFLFALLGVSLLVVPINDTIATLGIRHDVHIHTVVCILPFLLHLLYYICLFLYKVLPKKLLFTNWRSKICYLVKRTKQPEQEQQPLLYSASSLSTGLSS